jgi:flagellar hook assembly protein FlgD
VLSYAGLSAFDRVFGVTYKAVFDILGRTARVILNDIKDPGKNTVKWDGNINGIKAPQGTYFIKIQSGSDIRTVEATLIQ